MRLLWALLFLALAIFFAGGVAGRPMPSPVQAFLIPEGAGPGGTSTGSSGGGAGSHDELAWMENDLAGALARAKAENRPVFVDFTGVG